MHWLQEEILVGMGSWPSAACTIWSLIGLLMGRAGPDFNLWMAHPPGSGPDFDPGPPTGQLIFRLSQPSDLHIYVKK